DEELVGFGGAVGIVGEAAQLRERVLLGGDRVLQIAANNNVGRLAHHLLVLLRWVVPRPGAAETCRRPRSWRRRADRGSVREPQPLLAGTEGQREAGPAVEAGAAEVGTGEVGCAKIGGAEIGFAKVGAG